MGFRIGRNAVSRVYSDASSCDVFHWSFEGGSVSATRTQPLLAQPRGRVVGFGHAGLGAGVGFLATFSW